MEVNKEVKSKESSGFVTVKGGTIHYIIEGAGIPCIVIGTSIYHSRTFSRKLRDHLKLIFMDDRAYAPSTSHVPLEEISMETLLDDIDHVRQALGFDKIAVMGHSAFALVALEFARKYPEHASHAVMIAMTPHWTDETRKIGEQNWDVQASEERKQILKRNQENLTEEILNKVSPSEAFIMHYVANGPMAWYDPTFDCSELWEGVELNMDVFNHFFYVILNKYVIHPREVTTPVFLALGKSDFVCPYHLWDEIKEEFTELSYHLFEKSGHTPQLEEQALFDEKLIDWITRSYR